MVPGPNGPASPPTVSMSQRPQPHTVPAAVQPKSSTGPKIKSPIKDNAAVPRPAHCTSTSRQADRDEQPPPSPGRVHLTIRRQCPSLHICAFAGDVSPVKGNTDAPLGPQPCTKPCPLCTCMYACRALPCNPDFLAPLPPKDYTHPPTHPTYARHACPGRPV